MRYLLDTNVLVAMFRGRQRIREALLKVGFDNCSLSEISIAELLFGAYKSDYSRHRHEFLFVKEHFNIIPISDSLEQYARLRAELETEGIRLDNFDLLIAATAVKEGLTLVTHNTKHFEKIPNLHLKDWECD